MKVYAPDDIMTLFFNQENSILGKNHVSQVFVSNRKNYMSSIAPSSVNFVFIQNLKPVLIYNLRLS